MNDKDFENWLDSYMYRSDRTWREFILENFDEDSVYLAHDAFNAANKLYQEKEIELYKQIEELKSQLKGPDGFETWKEAAINERKLRVQKDMLARKNYEPIHIQWETEETKNTHNIIVDIFEVIK